MRPRIVRLLVRSLRVLGVQLTPLRRSRVYRWTADGSIRAVTPPDGFFYQPCVHPDGSAVVCHGGTAGPLRLYRTVFAIGETEPLTPDDSAAVHPAYAWDGESVVFASDRDWPGPPLRVETAPRDEDASSDAWIHFDLYLARADGSSPQRLTSDGCTNRRPCLSPDGSRVAYLSGRSGETELWLLDTARPGERRCLEVGRQGWEPRRPWFSADGCHVYFCGREKRGPAHRICRVPATGGPVVPLANDDAGMSHGVFADPDGRTLLIHSTRGGPFNIWELPLDGSPARPLHPPGFRRALHATRARDGTVTFDVPRLQWRRNPLH